MKLWHKILITFIAILITSLIADIAWAAVFPFLLPAYVAGVIGGFMAIPVWELLRMIDMKKNKNRDGI